MTTTPIRQPDFTSQAGTRYKTNIDNTMARMIAYAGQFCVSSKSGSNIDPTAVPDDMTVWVQPGRILTGTLAAGTLASTAVAAQASSAFTAPTVNPRIDLVVIDALTGAASAITGVENASPAIPAIPAGKIPVAYVTLQTSTTTIDNTMITDIRLPHFVNGNSTLYNLELTNSIQ